MKKNLIFSGILLVYVLGFWVFYTNVIAKQPKIADDLQSQIGEKKRQLLSAQIISKNLQNVNVLIQNNLVNSLSDSLARPANMVFLQYLTGLMDKLEIVLVSIKPADILKPSDTQTNQWEQTGLTAPIEKDYIEIPYSMTILASYTQLGRFFEELERSPRLIKIVRFQLDNPIDFSVYEGEVSGKADQHRINLDIHTLTILKASFKGGQE